MNNSATRLRARVKSLAYGGAFVCEVEGGGKKVFIRDVIPGEVVTAEVITEQPRFLEARLIQIESASEHRRQPACSYFGQCGGCDLQHMTITAQRAAKVAMVESMLSIQAKLWPEQGVNLIGAALPEFNYRRRVSLHINSAGQVGFYRPKSGEVVAISSCLISTVGINEAIKELNAIDSSMLRLLAGVTIEAEADYCQLLFEMRAGVNASDELLMTLSSRFDYVTIMDDGKVILNQVNGSEVPVEQTAIGRFSQVNTDANKLLIETVLAQVSSPQVTDLYAGSGNFSIPLAESGHAVRAVEADQVLVQIGTERAKQLGLNLTFSAQSCERWFTKNSPGRTIVLDPPRSGAKDVIGPIVLSAAQQVIYVSCNLPSLARDLRKLVDGGFKLVKVDCLDMFAQTHHIETVSVLVRSGLA